MAMYRNAINNGIASSNSNSPVHVKVNDLANAIGSRGALLPGRVPLARKVDHIQKRNNFSAVKLLYSMVFYLYIGRKQTKFPPLLPGSETTFQALP
jgi:hypothetical protein